MKSPHSIRTYGIECIATLHFVSSMLNSSHDINVNRFEHRNYRKIPIFPNAVVKNLTMVINKHI